MSVPRTQEVLTGGVFEGRGTVEEKVVVERFVTAEADTAVEEKSAVYVELFKTEVITVSVVVGGKVVVGV